MIARRTVRYALAPILTLAMIGCSKRYDDLPREPVAGTVTMDDQPLPEALIQFTPTGDTKLTGASVPIKDGQFSIPREDGLVPGTYKVFISHAEVKQVTAKPKSKVKMPVSSIPSRTTEMGPEQIPARYNSKSELTAEIKPGGARDLKFELQSK
jgi:hypothetical protein